MTQASEQAAAQNVTLWQKLKDQVMNTKFSSGVIVGAALTGAGIAGVKAYKSKVQDETGGSGNQ